MRWLGQPARRGRAGRVGLAALALLSVGLAFSAGLAPGTAHAFSLFPEIPGVSVQDTLSKAARWSSVTGLEDGLQVGIAPGVAAALQAPGDALGDIEQAIVDGILAWESPALSFDMTLDGVGAVEGPDAGFEIDFFAVPASHPRFLFQPQLYGLAVPSVSFFDERPLTNGQTTAGYAITGADIFFNVDNFQFLAPLGALRLDVLTRVTIHELGHALGFGHPNEFTNFDTNNDPFDVMDIDPNDPFAGLIVSPFFDVETVMSNEPCGPNPTGPCPGAFFTQLGNDERGGRDVLYPVVPEPSTGALLGVAVPAALAIGRRGARRAGPGPIFESSLRTRSISFQQDRCQRRARGGRVETVCTDARFGRWARFGLAAAQGAFSGPGRAASCAPSSLADGP